MDYKKITFAAPWQVEIQDDRLDLEAEANTAYIRTEHSLVSPGTELAMLSGNESWAALPCDPGYGSVGTIIQAGDTSFKKGDRVFTYGKHAAIGPVRVLSAAVPDGLDGQLAVFARMAAVAITPLRLAQAALGEWVAVCGAGLVGNFAAQLFSLAGCQVVIIDPQEKRLELARRCGITHTVAATGPEAVQAVRDLSGGHMCTTVVEATGVPAAAAAAADLAAAQGEVILVGSPRGEHQTDLTQFLNKIHLWGNGCITFKGAHEWRLPIRGEGHRFTIEKNVETLLGFIKTKRLLVEPLLSHVLLPSQAPQAYEGLRHHKDHYLGVVFDWT
jgi:threonine dehydrogenase-like Zn-dependent dehydrogenase